LVQVEYALEDMRKLFFDFSSILFFSLLMTTISHAQNSEKNEYIKSYANSLMNLNYQDALTISSKITNNKLKISMKNLATILYNNGQANKTNITYFKDSTISVNNNSIEKTINYLSKGYYILYEKTGEDSFEYFFNAYTLAKSKHHSNLYKLSLLGILEYYQFKYSQTNNQFETYIQEFEKICVSNLDYVWLYLYKVYFNLQSLSKERWSSIRDLKQLENRMLSVSKNSNLRPLFYSLKALKYEYTDSNQEALKYHQLALDLSKEKPFLKYIAFRSLIRMSIIAQKENDFEKGIVLLDTAINYIDKSDTLRSLIYINKYKSKHNLKIKNFETAYAQLEESIDLEHKLEYKTNMLEKSALEVKLRTAEKEKQILEEKQKAQITRNWLIAATIALVFGTGIAILVQKNTTKKRKLAEQETLLKQERVDNLLKQQELVSINAMIEGQEKERQRVANELHDDLGSLMATIKLHFSNVKGKGKDPALKQAQSLLEEAYKKVRGIAHSKNSGVMSSQGLLPAVKKMAYVISETNALEVSVEDFGMGERMENSLELSLFRTIQELVANAIKHAEATKLSIQISQYEDNLNIIIEDNGKGFDRSKIDKSKTGMGLTNIEKRIEHLEGNFTIDSVLGKGTSILIDIPV